MNKTPNDYFSLAVAAAPMSLEDKLGWHFANFKRIPKSMLQVCAVAIRLHDAGFDEDETILDLPAGVTRFGKTSTSIADVIAGHHLEPYLALFADWIPANPLAVPLRHG